ncbi:MAG TPA: GDSL-type esterase/lipase family protein [Gemmatimonadaceae bacterium]|nr:GDSL-type esterase/lipase family protein [Gemmatimonadaceae bacterium]
MRKSVVSNILLLCGSVLVAFILAELGLRVIQRVRGGIPMTSFLPEGNRHVFPRSPFLVFGPRVDVHFQRSGRPEWGRFNDMGIRLPFPTPPREPGEVRVLAIGGSTTEGLAADLGRRDVGIHWPLAFECLERSRGRNDVRVLNGAMSAYTTAHSLIRYALDLVETRPDVVLIKHNVNDLMVTYRAASLGTTIDPNYLVRYGRKRWTGYIDESDIVVSRVLHSARVRFGGDADKTMPWQEWKYDLAPGEHYFRRNLHELVRSVRQSGAVPVLLTESRSSDPNHITQARALAGVDVALTLYPDVPKFYQDFDRFNDVIREVAAAERIPLVDVAKGLPSDNALFLDVVHHSEEGVRAIARVVDSLVPAFLPKGSGATLKPEFRVSCEGVF